MRQTANQMRTMLSEECSKIGAELLKYDGREQWGWIRFADGKIIWKELPRHMDGCDIRHSLQVGHTYGRDIRQNFASRESN